MFYAKTATGAAIPLLMLLMAAAHTGWDRLLDEELTILEMVFFSGLISFWTGCVASWQRPKHGTGATLMTGGPFLVAVKTGLTTMATGVCLACIAVWIVADGDTRLPWLVVGASGMLGLAGLGGARKVRELFWQELAARLQRYQEKNDED